MQSRCRFAALTLPLFLAACTPAPFEPPVPDATTGTTYHLQAVQALPVVAIAVDSESMPKAQLADGNPGTAWTNGGFKDATAFAQLQFAQVSSLGSIAIKTGPSPAGTKYDVQVSATGSTWTTVLANQANTTWNVETKVLPAGTSGKFLRIFWHNSPTAPQPHFAIYELSASGGAAANQPPVLTGLTQAPLKIVVGGHGTLTAQASDPNGDALTYVWHAQKGTITGSGPSVTYTPTGSLQPPNGLDDLVTVTVSDGKAAPVSKSFAVDTFLGSVDSIPASGALQWAPAKTAFAGVSGTVTATASGFFSVYNAVIAEYTTAKGRQMALLHPGTTTLQGVTGNVFMYLVGPTGPNTPTPSIKVVLNGVARTITQANVVASQHVGYQPLLGPGNAGFFADLTTAKNGANPYQTLLDIRSNGLTAAPGLGNQGTIEYTLFKPGTFFFGFDGRVASGDADERVVLTDSLGGTGDNTGAWTIDSMAFDH
jgi:hypothetical protein